MIKVAEINPLGLGTWGIGGFREADPSIDGGQQADAVAYSLNNGVNYVETTLWYAQGRAASILSQGIERADVDRDRLFVSQSLYDNDGISFPAMCDEVFRFQDVVGVENVDALMVTMSGLVRFGFDEVTTFLESQLAEGRARHVSVTNADATTVYRLAERFGSAFFGHELPYSFEIRDLEDVGVVGANNECAVKTVVYQPLRRNRTAMMDWPLLTELASQYNATVNQILLAWLTQRGMMVLVKSDNIAHIDSNHAALNIELQQQDVDRLNRWRPDYVRPPIVWPGIKSDDPLAVAVTGLSNVFDERYDAQHADNR